MKEVLVLTHSFPSKEHLSKGIFIKDEISLLKKDINFNLALAETHFSKITNQYEFENDITISRIGYFSFPTKSIKLKKGKYISKSVTSKLNIEKYDIIHAHFLIPSGLALGYVDKPSVLTIHGSDWNVFKQKKEWRAEIEKAFNRISKIITVSKALEEDILSYYPNLKNKIVSIPHSIDEFWFKSLYGNKKINDAQISIVVVASMVPIKGLYHFIKALSLLKTDKKIEIDIFSIRTDKNYKSKVDSILPEISNEVTINFHSESSRETIREYYSNADFAVLPSLKEGFGLSIIEAHACGLPVISTRSGGPESIINDTNGVLVIPGNSEALSLAIDDMIKNFRSFDRASIISNVKKKYHPSIRKEAMLSVYDSILQS